MYKYVVIVIVLLTSLIGVQFFAKPYATKYLKKRDMVNRLKGECSMLLAHNLPVEYERLEAVCSCYMDFKETACGLDAMCYRKDFDLKNPCFKPLKLKFSDGEGK